MEGNVQKMREAIETALTIIRGIINGTIARTNNSVFDCRDKLKEALAAPPRNCDIYGDYDSICKAWEKSVRTGGLTFGEWTFAQAMEKEGGAE